MYKIRRFARQIYCVFTMISIAYVFSRGTTTTTTTTTANDNNNNDNNNVNNSNNNNNFISLVEEIKKLNSFFVRL